jgi:gluconate kinase
MVVIIFGVSGAGKTTIGQLLADELSFSDKVKLLFLRGDYELIADQLRERRGHFMNPALLQCQFADLEEPQPAEGAAVIALGRSPRELVQEIKSKLQSS